LDIIELTTGIVEDICMIMFRTGMPVHLEGLSYVFACLADQKVYHVTDAFQRRHVVPCDTYYPFPNLEISPLCQPPCCLYIYSLIPASLFYPLFSSSHLHSSVLVWLLHVGVLDIPKRMWRATPTSTWYPTNTRPFQCCYTLDQAYLTL
jgi:hypothetical protein